MHPPSAEYPPHTCPLCGQPNDCAMAPTDGSAPGAQPCWCTREVFSNQLLQRLPIKALGQACICANCVKASQK